MEVVKETDADRREERKVFPGKKGTQRQAHTKPFACKKDAGLQLIHDVPIVQYLVVPLKKERAKEKLSCRCLLFRRLKGWTVRWKKQAKTGWVSAQQENPRIAVRRGSSAGRPGTDRTPCRSTGLRPDKTIGPVQRISSEKPEPATQGSIGSAARLQAVSLPL